MTGIVLEATEYQRSLWKYQTMVEPGAAAAAFAGRGQYGRWDEFCGELFAHLYADDVPPVSNPASDAGPYQDLFHAGSQLPEIQDLRTRARGDEWLAGIGASAMADSIISSTKGQEPVRNPEDDQRAEEMLERLLEQATNPEETQAIDEALQAARNSIQDAAQGAQQWQGRVDASEVREGLRRAAGAAQKAMDEAQAVREAFGPGWGNEARGTAGTIRGSKMANLVEAVKSKPNLKRLAELAGRLSRIARERQRAKPRRGAGEVTGIERGDDLQRMVPVEALAAMDPDLEAVFAARLAERALACREMKDRPNENKGPIVICLDSSGSMSGEPQAWAGAVALALLQVAASQKRAAAIIHFGTKVERVDLFNRGDHKAGQDLMDAVTFFAGSGGTNFGPALRKAIQIQDGPRDKADILFVTDGYARLNSDDLEAVNAHRSKTGTRIFSVLIGTDGSGLKPFSDLVVTLESVLKDDKALDIFGMV
jgi:uncharacterized protein with von Willebrand factor type A (vWA) domain